jgi:hypothetical protein
MINWLRPAKLRWRSFASNRTTGSGSVGATFQLAAKFGLKRPASPLPRLRIFN